MTHPYRRAVLAGLAGALLVAAPAAADPSFEPDEAPVDSLAELELDLAHGCVAGGGHAHDGDEEQPTVEVAVQVPAEVEYAQPEELDGWELDVEVGDDERIVITWTAEEGTREAAPVFELEAVLRGEVGDEVAWPVFQECEEGSYRWVASSEDPEGDPAPVVTLTEADPDAPPPEDPQGMGVPEEPGVAEELEPEDTDEPDGTDPDEDAGDADDDEPEELDADDAADGGLPGWTLLIVVLVVVLAVGGVLLARSRSRSGRDTGGPA